MGGGRKETVVSVRYIIGGGARTGETNFPTMLMQTFRLIETWALCHKSYYYYSFMESCYQCAFQLILQSFENFHLVSIVFFTFKSYCFYVLMI